MKKIDNVVIPEYENNRRIELFADISRGAGNDDLIKQYFDAGFTCWVMTEDDAKITDEAGNLNIQYLNNIGRVSKFGEVWPRNTYNYPHCWINPETTTATAYGRPMTFPKREITTEFNEAGNVTGYYHWDEPSFEKVDTILPLVEWHNTYAKDKVFHINLLPSYGSSHFSMTDLEGYVQHYVDTILAKVQTPKNLGLDNYPLINRGEGNVLRTSYLSDLLTVANIAKEYNAKDDKTSELKLGFCIQSFCDHHIRTPESLADITFQVNCCLAMGAKYLEYFLYCPIRHMFGLVDEQHKKLPVYDYVKQTNEELNSWDHVIMAFEWIGVQTVNGIKKHDNKEAFELLGQGRLERLQKVEQVEGTMDTLIGEFIDENGYYGYMTVNYTEPSKEMTDDVTYTFREDVKKVLVYQNGTSEVHDVDVNHQFCISIPAGGGAFVIPCS